MKVTYLGFGFYKDSKTKKWACRPHQTSEAKFKRELKKLTQRRRGINFRDRVGCLDYYMERHALQLR